MPGIDKSRYRKKLMANNKTYKQKGETMKKILSLLFLLTALAFHTAEAAVVVYPVNIGATAPIDMWQPYEGPSETYTVYDSGAWIFGIGSILGESPVVNIDAGFTGYATQTWSGSDLDSVLVFGLLDYNTDPYYLVAFSSTYYPTLSTMDPAYGTIDTLMGLGMATLGGNSYFASAWSTHLSVDGEIWAVYNVPLNAVTLSTPEPATIVLLSLGAGLAAFSRKNRLLEEA
jgi:hypothetical protein